VIGEQIVDFAGTGQGGYNEGPLLDARFSMPSAVASLGPGRLLVGDSGNHRIRLLDLASKGTSSFAGTGAAGFLNGPTDTARFDEPGSMVVVGGEVYVVDVGNHRLRKIGATGEVTTFAGNDVDAIVDGPLLDASFHDPHGIAYDATSAAFYVTECWGNVVRKISSGQVTTFAGGAAGFADGPRLQAQFHCPAGIVAHNGALIVADCDNNRIRLIRGESVTTLAGAGQFGHQDGPAAAAVFACPDGIALDAAAGILYVSDYGVMPEKEPSVYIRAITGLVL
jgi:DNA-binding beta-propeller fold protein YncE